MYKKSLCLSKDKLTHEIGLRSMAMWDSVPVKKIIVPVLHPQIGLGNDVLKKLLGLIESGVEKLSTVEEVTRNTMVTLNQVIVKIRQNCKI